jgi:competence protein ComEC
MLSFAATAGLVLYTGPLERWFERALARVTSVERARKIVGLISEAFIVTLAAQITTMPIILHYFGRLSLVTLLTNFLILPVQSMVMIAGGIAVLLGLVFLPLGQVAGWVAWVFLTYTIGAVRLTARVPSASVEVQMAGWMVWGYYALLGALTWWTMQPQERRRELWAKFSSRLETRAIVGASIVLLALALFAWGALPDGDLHVSLLDVGQGDAIFIQTPGGKQVLVDGGPSETALLAQLGRHMPFWDRSLDVVVLTHPDADHVSGLVAVLDRYRVDTVVSRQIAHESSVYERWQQLLQAEGATVYQGQAGLHVALDAGLEMTVLHPGPEPVRGTDADVNNNSIVARLVYGDVSLLLTGDIEAVIERRLLAQGVPLESTVLKAAHHGSCSSSTPEFLAAVDPGIVVISVGADNDFGHPCAEVLERLAGLPVYRTDEQGVVEIVSDGTRVWVETER